MKTHISIKDKTGKEIFAYSGKYKTDSFRTVKTDGENDNLNRPFEDDYLILTLQEDVDGSKS